MKYTPLPILLLLIALGCAQQALTTSSRNALEASGYKWPEPYTHELAAYVQPEECDPRGCNLTPALDRAEAACELELAGATGNRPLTGCRFLFPAGDHRITRTIRTCRAHTYEGRGGAHRRAQTTITATVGVWHGQGFGTCGGSAAGAITVRHLGLIFPSGPHDEPIIGIHAEAKVHIESVWMIYADLGVWITADVSRTPKSNANAYRIYNLATEYTRHAGVLIQGGDANAGVALALNVSTACLAKQTEEGLRLQEKFGPCAGYRDRSFLGSFVLGAHFAAAEGEPDFEIAGASNHGACFGCYVEGSTPPALSAQWSQWIGGIGPHPTGPGFRLDGNRTTSFRVVNDLDPANVVTFELGRQTATLGTFWAARHHTNNWPLRFKWRPDLLGGVYLEDVGNAAAGQVLTIRGTREGTDASPLGRLRLLDVELIKLANQ